MDTASTFGQWLKQRRRDFRLTQAGVADATGCSRDTIRKIESGLRRPSRQIAELLADCLYVEPQQRAFFLLWARGLADMGALDSLASQEPWPQVPPAPAEKTNSWPVFAPNPTTSLPLLPTSLIGRERDLAHARVLLWRSTTRLLTLLGPPGIGKTSLCISLASTLQADFKDGLLYVPLGPISDPALVASTLAEGLRVRETSARPTLDALRDALRDKQMLLILDNFEHVVAAAPLLAELLAAAPQLRVLVTSRSPLHIRGERLLEVAPLGLPDPQRPSSIEELERTGSVALFVERVRDVNSDFALTPDNAPVVAAICALLDGLPLAIELAAARTRLLSLPSLLSRLQRQSGQLDVLAGGPRDAPLHQKALRSALESSYTLLGVDEQALFRKVGIFAGPFTFEAAQAVAGATLDSLEAVLDQSLVHLDGRSARDAAERNSSGEREARYAMLVPVREYALEQLEAAGERHDIALGHARYFLNLVLAGEHEMKGPNQKLWLDSLGVIYSDIRTGLDWTLKNDQAEIALRLAGVMGHFWRKRGYRQEGCGWLQMALSQAQNAPPEARVGGLNTLGVLYQRQGEPGAAESILTEAVALSREVGDRLMLARSLRFLGWALGDLGEYDRAVQAHQESLSIARELGDHLYIAAALNSLGVVMAFQHDYEQASAWHEESLAIRRQAGIPLEVALSLQALGLIALKQGDYRRAIAYSEEVAAITRGAGDKDQLAHALNVVGKAALGLGDYERAATSFTQCLSLFVELGMVGMVALVLEEIARIATGVGQPARAVRLFGVAEALRESVGAPADPPDRIERDEAIATLRQSLSEPEFNAARAVGRCMPLEEAVSYATVVAATYMDHL